MLNLKQIINDLETLEKKLTANGQVSHSEMLLLKAFCRDLRDRRSQLLALQEGGITFENIRKFITDIRG